MKRQIMSYKFLSQSYTYCFIYRAEFPCIDRDFVSLMRLNLIKKYISHLLSSNIVFFTVWFGWPLLVFSWCGCPAVFVCHRSM